MAGVYQQLVHFDAIFHSLKEPPLIINDLMSNTEEERENIKKTIYTQYNTDMLSNLPRCGCGNLTREHLIGVICPLCKTPVKAEIEQEIEPILWMRAPNGIAKLINPIIWTMLSRKFTRSGFDVIQWICDTRYVSQSKTPPIINEIQALGIQRGGYNYFVENFDFIIEILFSIKSYTKKKERQYLKELIELNRNIIFNDYIPLPNKSLLVIEDKDMGYTVIDPIVVGAIDAIQMISGIDSEINQYSIRTKENRTIKTLVKLADFSENFYKSSLSGKTGIYRKHIFGSRSHFSFRAVISSITEPHDDDEMHVPWGIATSVFRIHLLNKLFRRGYTMNGAVGLLNEHAQKYCVLLDDLFKEIISEGPDGKISCCAQRNPSLERGSAQLFYITKVKTNPYILTVSIPILSTRSFNADFDGKNSVAVVKLF